jgi:hypothetical protein
MLSGTAYAVPKVPTWQITRAGPTTTYKVFPNSPYTPPVIPPTGTGLVTIADNVAVNAAGKYVTGVSIPIGETIAAVQVANSIAPAAIATAAATLLGRLTAIGAVVSVGSALYDYFSDAGLKPNQTGEGDFGGAGSDGIWSNSDTIPITGANCTDSTTTPVDYCNTLLIGHPTRTVTLEGLTLLSNGSLFGICKIKNGTIQSSVSVACASTYVPKCQTPNTWDTNYSICSGPQTQLDEQEIDDKLQSYSPPVATIANLVKQLHDTDTSGLSDPEPSLDPDLTIDPASTSQTSPPVKTITPDARVQETTKTVDLTKTAPDTFTATETTTTTTTNPDGTTSTQTVTNAPTAPQTNTQTTTPQQQTDCEKFPDTIGCSKYGQVPEKEVIPITEIPAEMPYTPWGEGGGSDGNGDCPAPSPLPHGMVLDYQPMCDSLVKMKPIIISSALLISLFIVIGGIKE